MSIKKMSIIASASIVFLFSACKAIDDDLEVVNTNSELLTYKGLQVNHTYDVPLDIISNPDFNQMMESKANDLVQEDQELLAKRQKSESLETPQLTTVMYDLIGFGDIIEQEEAFVPNEEWSDSQIINKIYQDFPTINSLREIEYNWETIRNYYSDIVQYNVSQRLDEVATSNDGGGLLLKSSIGEDGLDACEFIYLSVRWSLALAVKRAAPEARTESVARWPGNGNGLDREDVMRHLGLSWLLPYYYSKSFLIKKDINHVYDKAWGFLHYREESLCAIAIPMYDKDMDHRNNYNGINHWKYTSSEERYGPFNIFKRIRSRDKGDALDFLSDVKTFWSVKLTDRTSQAIDNVDIWSCVYFND